VTGGLDGVVACESAVTLVDGENGELFFRGYAVRDFADRADYLRVVQLLWHGTWPSQDAQNTFERRIRAQRQLPAEVHQLLQLIPVDTANPMSVIRTVVSLLGARDAGPEHDVLAKATSLLARMPTLVAAIGRLMRGQQPIEPDPELGHATNYLYMLRGTRPSADEAAGLNTLLTLHAEHELNASTFAARTVVGTLSDYHSAITAAVGALKGARHGGAIDAVVPLVDEIGSPDAVPAFVSRALADKRKLPGFGHRVYRRIDPRAALQAAIVRRLSTSPSNAMRFQIAQRLESEMLARKGLPANVDYYAALALSCLGFPPDLFTSFIASTRITGWTAHIFEQYADNRLIRPRAEYRGLRDLVYAP
jgi:citrate synthase